MIESVAQVHTPADTKIAGRKTCAHWTDFKAALVPGCDSALWQRAASDYFHVRLSTRYLEPIRAIQAKSSLRGEGFSVVAIQCSLIEFLESTIQGLTYAYRRCPSKEPRGKYEYSDSQCLFVDFLRKRHPFHQHFTTKKLANDFYVGVRCGLLHEARTKNGWVIHSKGLGIIDVNDAHRKIVYHVNFQEALLEFAQWYETQLLSNNSWKEAFVRKFDSLCT